MLHSPAALSEGAMWIGEWQARKGNENKALGNKNQILHFLHTDDTEMETNYCWGMKHSSIQGCHFFAQNPEILQFKTTNPT